MVGLSSDEGRRSHVATQSVGTCLSGYGCRCRNSIREWKERSSTCRPWEGDGRRSGATAKREGGQTTVRLSGRRPGLRVCGAAPGDRAAAAVQRARRWVLGAQRAVPRGGSRAEASRWRRE
eukprot:81645-Prymnesium_polylepis.2